MNPFYFGKDAERLFGIYTAARDDCGPARAAVLCSSWGPEYIHAHRAVRQAANMLSAAGINALRFDYFGTGDSAGEMTQASLDIWEDNIRAAMQEAAAMSGAAHVTLIGLRLGALLAARVAAAQPSLVDQLVLWDPVLNGQDYLHELLDASRAELPSRRGPIERPASDGGGLEVLGFPMTEAIVHALRGLDIGAVAADLPSSTCVLLSGKPAEAARTQNSLVPPLTPSAIDCVEGPACWIEYWPPSERSTPVALLNRLVERTRRPARVHE